MFTKVDFFARCRRSGLKACAAGLAVAALSGCALLPPAAGVLPAAREPAPAQTVGSAGPNSASTIPSVPPADAVPLPDKDAVVRVLAYFDRIRNQSAAELSQEVARLGNPYVPANQLQLALTLGQLRQTPELVRAQELLTRLLANPDAEAQVLHPLARLLAARFGEQRRYEDLLDKQTQQTREVQRRLDQTHERLEALKAIERSLTSRPPAPITSVTPITPITPVGPAASAPVNRSRPATP